MKASDFEKIVNKKSKVNIKKNEQLEWDMIDE
jgi:sialic acid synthase SpsE